MSFSVNARSHCYQIQDQHPCIQAQPVRIGWGQMEKTTTDQFVDVWWRFYVNDEPGMIIHGPGGDISLPAGRLAILPAWITWQLTCKRKLSHVFVEVECPALSTQQVQAACDGAYLINKQAGQLFVDSVRAIRQGQHINGSGHVIQAGVHQAMATVIEQFAPTAITNQLLLDIVNYIDEHIADDLRIPELAYRFNCSPKHITNLFNHSLQQSPAAYIRERRLTKACSLLRETQLSVEQIAEAVGFANRAYLSRVMRQDMNVPPATYRKRNQI